MNTAGILGMENAQAVTFNSTSTIRTSSCLFAEDAGVKSLTKI